jgi:putative transcriptional regulator
LIRPEGSEEPKTERGWKKFRPRFFFAKDLRRAKVEPNFNIANLGVSRQTINAIDTEKYDPSLPLAFKVARLFQQSIEEIFTLDEDRA